MQALSWDKVQPVVFDDSLLPSTKMLEELLKQRRTIRFFKNVKLNRELVEEIIGYGIYAPTNNYELRIIVVDEVESIIELDQVVMQFVKRIYSLFFRSKLIFNFIKSLTPIAAPKDKVKMESAIMRNTNYTSLPSTIILIIGDKRTALSVESAQFSLYNMILMAQVNGIGSRLKGAGQIILDRNKKARKILGINRHEHILGMLELGIPDVRFRNKVEGKTFPIQWTR
jgi:nitroreductase